jgi:hypothetical protein
MANMHMGPKKAKISGGINKGINKEGEGETMR